MGVGALLFVAGGISCSGPEARKPLGDGSVDRPAGDGSPGLLPAGQPCGAAGECASGFCFDGVCCQTDCSTGCHTCNAPGNAGTCIPSDVGTDPRNDCTDDGAMSCGHDGYCDGVGSCELYAAGVACGEAGCSGNLLSFACRCDGKGGKMTNPTVSCAPYMCAANGQCRTTCSVDADCSQGNTCNSGSCGLKPPGAGCAADPDCQSGHCEQGACCQTTCTGTCMSCAIPGNAGACIAVPAGQDPLAQCSDSTAMSCSFDGFCDGHGACEIYASGTVCGTDTCSDAQTQLPASRCNGTGMCVAQATHPCGQYACSGGQCLTKCSKDGDCASGFFCVGSICAKKPITAVCSSGAECASGHCEQGVCCNTACTGVCMSCNLTNTNTVGTCTPIPAGTAMPTQCMDTGSTSCGTNGKCDGAGACQLYTAGTICMAASCTGSTLTQARTCDGAGVCRPPGTAMCDPFQCGTNACKTTCTTATQATDCLSPNTCVNGSCGKKPPGASCVMGTECQTGFCAQGVCCNNACGGTCQSCALTGSPGICTNIPAGQAPTPASQCPAAASSTCGLDGTCDGKGACRNFVSGTQCAGSKCPAGTNTFTPPQLCDGAGHCAAATSTTCGGNFVCDGTANQCKVSPCAADADCVSPNICNAGACTLKPQGRSCTVNGECASNACSQGVCCDKACTGTCQSCALTNTVGTCTFVGAGKTDPMAPTQCPTTQMSTCGTDGTCDGAGHCRQWIPGTVCVPQSCVVSTLTPARTCDGAGTCRTVNASLCDPRACDTTTNMCKTTCTSNADCAAGATCNTATGACGTTLPDGSSCSTGPQCNSGICAQGVCCHTACGASCTSCNVTGSAGTCLAVPPGGTDPQGMCVAQAVSTCGLNGFCDGNGACQKFATGTTCQGATCSGSFVVGASTCSASGVCTAPAPNPQCSPFQCSGGACKTTCTADGDCVSPNVCTGGTCVPPINITVLLKEINIGTTQLITPNIRVINNGTSPITLSQLTVRYWYTMDTPSPPLTVNCDYSLLPTSCGAVSFGASSFVSVSPARTNADSYFQYGFTAAAGTLAPGNTQTDVQLRWSKTNFINFDQTNDYSYNAATAYTATTKVTVYLNGALVYGTEPM